MADISKISVNNTTYDIKDTSARTAMTGATSSAAGTSGAVPAPSAGDDTKFLRGDGTWGDGGKPMVILSYGNSTWQDFINAYNNNVIVYCRASSNSNPATGSQTRMAFMAYVNNATTPTEVEFQYYRSVSTHSASQQGDQVFVYKLTSSGSWTVTTREAMAKIVAGTNLSSSYSNGTLTLNGDYSAFTGATSSANGAAGLVPAPSSGDEDKVLAGDGTWKTIQASMAGNIPEIWFTTCSTEYNVLTKQVSIPAITQLKQHTLFFILFVNAHYASSGTPQLQINSFEALNIVRIDSTSVINYWSQNEIVAMHYDGSTFMVLNHQDLSNYVQLFQGMENVGKYLGVNQYGAVSPMNIPSLVGATSSTAGTSGLVPAPSAGDQGKVLFGDGTWDNIPGSTIEYSASAPPANPTIGMVWLKQAPMSLDEAKVLILSTTASSLPTTISNNAITSDMVVLKSELGDPSAQSGDLTVTTSAGSLTIAGTLSGSTTITLYLLRSR